MSRPLNVMPRLLQFGEFFRARRRSLGLSLREFCRRNGFDPGNISRLERGLVEPSRSEDILTAYASALKLLPGSDDWHRLFESAAVATGTLPPEVAHSPASQEALPSVFRTLRSGTRRMQPWVNALEIDRWAGYNEPRHQLPRLIRRLIHATAKSLERIEFAAGEGGQLHGWDGLVRAAERAAFVPNGLSAWEVSVAGDPAKKADRDFRERSKNPRQIDPSEATYLCVTARRWEKKRAWEDKKNKLRIWKEVRVYDADSLEEWLELAPAVDTWFARLLGKPTEGMLDVGEYWERLACLTEPPLKPTIFLVSRDVECQALDRWLTGPPSSLAIEARAPSEAIDFLAAYLANLGEDQRDPYASRVVIVESREAWNVLRDEPAAMTLVPTAGLALEAEAVGDAVRKGHRVLLCSERFATEGSQKLVLPRPNVYELERSLQESGFDAQTAGRGALDCGGSLTILKRRLARFPSTAMPQWSAPEAAEGLAPLILVGSWSDVSQADQAAVAKLLGRSYSQIAEALTHWSTTADPPVFRLPSGWSLASREDSWVLLERYINEEHLDRWQELAIEVLGQDDPRLDLPADSRWLATTPGDAPSELLRTGIAETLAMLAAPPSKLGSVWGAAGARAEKVVWKVLGGNPGWKRWASLGRQLPLLAEAAPNTFLSAVEAELRENSADFMRLLEKDGDSLFSRCMHVGLLWALETLAWTPRFLRTASIVLAQLAELMPEKRGNHPASSLKHIFMSWLPRTTASVDDRTKVLRKITEKCPRVGWQLLLDLISTDSSSDTCRPKWRDWAATWKSGASGNEYRQQIDACGNRLLEMVETDTDRWAALISHIGNLSPDSRQMATSMLRNLDITAMSVEARQKLADALRGQVQRHRSYPDSQWAMPAAEVTELEQAHKHIEPTDHVARNVWLFANWPRLAESPGGGLSWDSREKKIARQRREALNEVFKSGGIEEVLRLASSVEDPWAVGLELANTGFSDQEAVLPVFLDNASTAAIAFARGYAEAHFKIEQWDWVNGLPLKDWSPSQTTSLALALPFERQTWDLVATHSQVANDGYWDAVNRRGRLTESADVEHAVARLLARGRPFTAICVLDASLHAKAALKPLLLAETLEATLLPANEGRTAEMGHSILDLFIHLQSQAAEIDDARLANLEWNYLELLDGRPARPCTLLRVLSSEPTLFAEILRRLYRSNEESNDTTHEPSEVEQSWARSAFKLLHLWDTIPGLDETTQTVNEDALRSWVIRARELCRKTGHLEICDLQVGEVLANAPKSDGIWPCIPVRDLIEELESEELCEGFVNGRLNKRGVYVKSPMRGGGEEDALAAEYAGYAEACQIEWPRTAEALRSIARRYESHARREDAQAEARRLGRWG